MTTQQVREKRTYDRRVYTIDCTNLLDATETITSVTSVTADQGGLVFQPAVVNTTAVTFPDGSVAAIGKAMQVRIDDGAIPAGQLRLNCTVRFRMATNLDPRLEATVLLRLNDEAF